MSQPAQTGGTRPATNLVDAAANLADSKQQLDQWGEDAQRVLDEVDDE
ncbi:MAG TPA: hypothetical protein VFZ62_03300 [Candidatus Saccharimonadales bacterium]